MEGSAPCGRARCLLDLNHIRCTQKNVAILPEGPPRPQRPRARTGCFRHPLAPRKGEVRRRDVHRPGGIRRHPGRSARPASQRRRLCRTARGADHPTGRGVSSGGIRWMPEASSETVARSPYRQPVSGRDMRGHAEGKRQLGASVDRQHATGRLAEREAFGDDPRDRILVLTPRRPIPPVQDQVRRRDHPAD